MDKEKLYQYCLEIVNSRLRELDEEIASLKEAKFKETKSTAGDKYETGRAMLQAEEDRLAERRSVSLNMLHGLKALDISKNKVKVGPGSLVITDKQNYFISAALGKVQLDEMPVFCISAVSPIGKALLGKAASQQIEFNGQEIQIEKIF
jgi:transcription elongation GreA/GreB family factor